MGITHAQMRSCTPAYKWSSRGFLPLSRSVVRVASARLVPLFLCFFLSFSLSFLFYIFSSSSIFSVRFSSPCLHVFLFLCFFAFIIIFVSFSTSFLPPAIFSITSSSSCLTNLYHIYFLTHLFFLSLSAWTCNRKSVHTSPAADMIANERDSEKSWSLTTEQVWDTERGEREQAAQRGGRGEREED